MAAGQDAWAELMRVSFGLVGTQIQAGEMMIASGSVVNARMTLIGDAARSPATADYEEIDGLMEEKFVAFSKVGHACLRQWSAMVIDTTEYAQEVSTFAFAGHPLDARGVQSLTEGWLALNARILAMTMETGGLAMAPLHKQSTENARRLS